MSSPYDPRYTRLRQRLREARRRAGLTQDEAGRALGTSQQFINRCEAGDRRVDVLELLDFARLYRTSVEWFLDLADEEHAADRDGRRAAKHAARLP